MKLHTTTIFFLMLSLLTVSCHRNLDTVKPKLQDTTSESTEHPAFNKEMIIDIEGDSIAGYGFIASGNQLKETVILIAGYPGNDTNFDIAQEIRRQGKNVIHFNHRGAWGSQGEYTYSNCLVDIENLIAYLSQEQVSQELKIDTNNFSLLGRSYGGGIALISGSLLPQVKKIIAISTVNYGNLMRRYDTLDELSGFKKYMQKQIMINHDIDAFLQELLDRKEDFDILTYADQLKEKKVLLIEDSTKNDKWIKQIKNSEFVVLESDHNFIDQRKTLQELIIQWLQKGD